MNILITGGAGFIGSNLAAYFSRKHRVTVFDSLTRPGSEKNAAWLASIGQNITFVKGEITDAKVLGKLVRGQDAVMHLAAQVAVTSSVSDPGRDFEVNLIGTFTLLEAIRKSGQKPLITYASTNKVYGDIDQTRPPRDRHKPVSEDQPLDFYSPYACSKGGADCYIHDYSRIYGIPTVVFRKSCIYGVRQFGSEDQGWVAHFVRRSVAGNPITIYGDGHQIRDLLNIDDLVRLYDLAIHNIPKVSGQIFNVGGGTKNAVNLLEVLRHLEKLLGHKIKVIYGDVRPGDQAFYVSDISKVKKVLGWEPEIGVEEGLKKLIKWVKTSP
jgi:CDP-paratose 2-epimerase